MQIVRSSVLALVLLAFGCATGESEAPAARIAAEESPTSSPGAAPSPAARPVSASATAPAAGERAPFVLDGDTVRVNNSLCASSRSSMAQDTLGQFVSRVQYAGNDPRFRGRTFEFNQCCGGCIARFPQQWAENADAILAFHGVDPPPAAP